MIGVGSYRATEHNIDMAALAQALGDSAVSAHAERFVRQMHARNPGYPQARSVSTVSIMVNIARIIISTITFTNNTRVVVVISAAMVGSNSVGRCFALLGFTIYIRSVTVSRILISINSIVTLINIMIITASVFS